MMIKLKFEELGRVLVPVHIKPAVGITMIPVRFKVDTGADFSTISKSDLKDLGYNTDWITQNAIVLKGSDRPTTASGESVDAGLVRLPLINLFGYECKAWPFQIIMNEKQDFRNLLGRDLLAGFNYWFSNDDETFSIERTKIFRPLYDFLPEQEIHEIKINS